MVLIDLDQLRTETGVGELGGEERLTAGEVRRMACTARLLPAVLGQDSEILDLGRTSRLFEAARPTWPTAHSCARGTTTEPTTPSTTTGVSPTAESASPDTRE